jgi:hypothetical protein
MDYFFEIPALHELLGAAELLNAILRVSVARHASIPWTLHINVMGDNQDLVRHESTLQDAILF